MKLFYTKSEVEYLRKNIYFTRLEDEVLELWLRDISVVESSQKLNVSTATIGRTRKRILFKIKKIQK